MSYDQTNLNIGINAQQGVVNADNYGAHASAVLNVVEPKNTYNVWYCNKITDGNILLQGIIFEYDKFGEFNNLNAVLSKKFKVDFEENVTLYTIRHFDDVAAKTVENDKTVLLKQISRETMQIVTKE